ncbi:GNAT family N-acetyltransferase [Streptomyces sp. TRM43335]|uniref:GNAT family N-acetyltransferase n=1 Tax=Streptomyces taklimakanensis TaxID=2569853 RepID=A0A6G2BE27_9ACTN|nr:GNAT family N-acetyltransferase [Streptomyces taklimakanensis]MTE20531.1 GNAT family N-acetyltransferase [Streptomyces taklimakanensis]
MTALTGPSPEASRTSQWRVRPYRPEDWEAVSRIHDTARLDELRDSVGVEAFLTLAETYEGEGLFDDRVWVAEDPAAGGSGTVVGFVALADDEVTWLYVDPDRYGEGVGTALLRHAVAHGGPRVETTVLAGNERALGLYLREGFVIVETKEGRLAGNEAFPATGHIMELRKPFPRPAA